MLGALGGVVLGIGLAEASLGLLSLRLLTGQRDDPDLVVPWISTVPVLVLATSVVAVVMMESSRQWRDRPGQVLRVGAG